MAIQTVVASYPDSFSPILNDQVNGNNTLANPRTSLNPELVTAVPQPYLNSTPSELCNGNIATTPTAALVKDCVSTPIQTAIHVKPITSPCHSTTSIFTFPL